jgi:hypothetical protein
LSDFNIIRKEFKIVSIPSNTTSPLEHNDQGAISAFKPHSLETIREVKGISEAIQVSNNATFKGYWKSYDIKKGISKISLAWSKISRPCMNGV